MAHQTVGRTGIGDVMMMSPGCGLKECLECEQFEIFLTFLGSKWCSKWKGSDLSFKILVGFLCQLPSEGARLPGTHWNGSDSHEMEPAILCSRFHLLPISLRVPETAGKCSIVHISDIPPSWTWSMSRWHHYYITKWRSLWALHRCFAMLISSWSDWTHTVVGCVTILDLTKHC